MKLLIPNATTNYRLLDSGNGLRLEQFGSNVIVRPDHTCLWQPSLATTEWSKADAVYTKHGTSTWTWARKPSFKEPWLFTYRQQLKSGKTLKFSCNLRLSQSKNIGIFPEQASQWEWMANLIDSVSYSPTVLNLFGYTGAATLCAAAAGAQVCHVDASQSAITFARTNQAASKLGDAPIRWIVEDCAKFIAREIKRGVMYDGIILDPPAFGHDPKGKIFAFEKNVITLLKLCKEALKPKPLFIIFNGYAMGHSATILKNIVSDAFPKKTIEFGELHIAEYEHRRTLPCSIFARISF